MALSNLNSLTDLGKIFTDPAGAAVDTAASSLGLSSSGTGGSTLGKYIIIILGLLLIAAGIFSFKEARTVIMTAGKAAATAA